MDLTLYKIAAQAVKDVYDGKCINIGSTEFAITETEYNNQPLQIISIAGTNEILDWFWNLNPFFWDNVKFGSWLSAKRILKRFIKKDIPLLITGHSKSGPTAEYLTLKLKADYCIAFCPTPGLRKSFIMNNTILFIDPDDIVPKVGKLLFKHPKCVIHSLPNEKALFSFKDHGMNHMIEYLNLLEKQENIVIRKNEIYQILDQFKYKNELGE